VLFAPARPEYRDALRYFRRLYAEGLLDPEGFTQNLQQFNAKGRSKTMVVGSFLDWLDENGVGLPRAVEDYQAVPPLKGPQGHRLWNRYDGEFFLSIGAFVITSANKHPEVAMRWVNELYDERLALEIARGPFGVTLKERPDGFVEFLPNPKGMGYGEFRFKNAPGDAFPGLVLQDTYARMGLPSGQKRKLDETYPTYKPFFPRQVYPKVLFTAEQEKRLSVLRTDLHGYAERMAARWIVGEEELTDASWNAFQDQLQKMGLRDLLAIYQETYDRYRGAR
jgi:putative aldouronate transport system substrate-binding protein